MVCGIGYTNSGKVKTSVSFLATVNCTFSRYWSDYMPIVGDQKEHDLLKGFLIKAMKQFDTVNGIHPCRIFVFREGAGGGLKGVNTVVSGEIVAFQKAISEFCLEKSQGD